MKNILKKLTALGLCILTVASPLAGCSPKDNDNDFDTEDEEYMKGHDTVISYETFDGDQEYILNSGSLEDYGETELSITPAVKYEDAKFSLKWERQDTQTQLRLKSPGDITDYQTLSFIMYSEKATGSTMQVCIYCQKTPEGKTAYKRHKITVDWTGWKRIDLKLEDFSDGYGADFSQVSHIAINTTGWSQTPDPETVLYIDSAFFANTYNEFSMEAEDIGDYNYDHITKTLENLITGGVSLKDAKDEAKTKIEGYVKTAKSTQSKMSPKGLPFNADMTSTAGITTNYNNIENMARGYAVKGSETYKDAKLLKNILNALDYMHETYYIDKGANAYPTRNNWWDWQIGSAQAIVNTVLLIREDITQEQIDYYLAPVNKYVPLPTMTMANRVDLAYVCFTAGALQKDYQRLAISRDAMDVCCEYVEKGDGFYSDGSFIQHDNIAYTGSYGPIMLEALSRIVISVADTCFRFDDEFIASQYSWAVDSYVPLMFHGAFHGHVRGRSITRTSTDVGLGLTAVNGMIRMTKYMTNDDDIKNIQSILKEYYQYNEKTYRSSLGPYELKILDEIVSDDSIAARTDYEFAKVFARMDRPVAQTADYGVGISLSSSRIAKYESFHDENTNGWYTGDGMLYIYTTVNDFEPAYWHNVNHYRLPGTTVTTAPRIQANLTDNTLSQYDFVGGVHMDNSMVAVMEFESAPSQMTSFSSTLRGKKAWFVFDNEIVCVGSGINCSDTFTTETIIENRRFKEGEKFLADGNDVTKKTGTLEGVKSLYINNYGGVYLPNTDKAVNFHITGGETSFLELYFNHGKNLTNDTYAYVLMPTMTSDEVAAYAASPEIEILVNNENQTVVRDKSTGMTGYVFWKAGTVEGVKATVPCTVLVSDGKVAVADPTQKMTSITVEVDGKSYTFDDLYKGSSSEKAR